VVNASEEMIPFSTPAEFRALFLVCERQMDTLQLKYSGIQIIIADFKKTICYNYIALKQWQTRIC